ncbi:UDP-N-acetylmuramoyl-L-alanine--D-glutamate ligase [Photobacterium leiognathi]|uniref:UDP-N-acetylmuramoylalanine--D-glutamate ligase n=1 Tax=Photobacterium leiognathi TaxID=553611 RepID=A0A2T3MCW4_PHOLE|nr:UDP-N-acetylmuramoyl-L-alanine--D-glutamate ligase [Photobacterium leiognathi]KJF99396.1 UDP-N-acetylmuramoyl-L-alanyl-D-glutamate synthetase [Photobacterium leiognathi]PSV91332.1 UDP-N-acetylmuramoyl-L-alanine--D-glutamate ligase [Photobacterium leiognathi]
MKGLAGVNTIVVIGLGMTGLSVVNHLMRLPQSLTIKVIDTRDNPPGQDQLPESVALCIGQWNTEWLLSADMIIASPGIALATPELVLAAEAGVEIIGDIELFAREVDKPVVAITGSNGKSTVTSLVGEMAKEAGIDVGVGGNIGFAALDMLAQQHQLYVLELSSFQLETTSSLELTAAVYLNLSEDHMDRYPGGLAQYSQAKMRIFDHAKLAVFNRDDLATKPTQFSGAMTSFGFDEQAYGIVLADGKEWLAVNGEAVMAVADIALVGRHNVANCLAALALADAAGVPRDASRRAMQHYTGLAHRCQLAVNRHGVRWVNDSKATNLASTLAALNGLQLEGKLHLLMGGDSKGAEFSELKSVLADLNVQLYSFGRDRHLFDDVTNNVISVETMSEAMEQVSRTLQSGDMVLLSPACASWDQFANFMARGDAFVEQAIKLQDSVSGNS